MDAFLTARAIVAKSLSGRKVRPTTNATIQELVRKQIKTVREGRDGYF
jgi:hypothetical protein